jgi:hypothetical protein
MHSTGQQLLEAYFSFVCARFSRLLSEFLGLGDNWRDDEFRITGTD